MHAMHDGHDFQNTDGGSLLGAAEQNVKKDLARVGVVGWGARAGGVLVWRGAEAWGANKVVTGKGQA